MDIGVPQSWRNERERYQLIGSECASCKDVFFPTRKICPNCRSDRMSEKLFKGNGKVVSYSTVFAAPTGFKMRVPYVLALVKLEEGPTVLGMLDDAKESEVKIGSSVEKIFRKWGDGKSSSIIHYGFAFRLA